jgi:hypothetical protein
MVVFLHSGSSVLYVCVDGVLWCSVRRVLVNWWNSILILLISYRVQRPRTMSITLIKHTWVTYLCVGIATDYGLDDGGVGVRVPVGLRFFSSLRRSDRFWGPPSLLSNGYQGLFPRGESGRGVKLFIHFQLVSRSRKLGSIHPLPPYAFIA